MDFQTLFKFYFIFFVIFGFVRPHTLRDRDKENVFTILQDPGDEQTSINRPLTYPTADRISTELGNVQEKRSRSWWCPVCSLRKMMDRRNNNHRTLRKLLQEKDKPWQNLW